MSFTPAIKSQKRWFPAPNRNNPNTNPNVLTLLTLNLPANLCCSHLDISAWHRRSSSDIRTINQHDNKKW